jgi:uncharacterized repeat protein (TIGR03847 family)
MTIEIGLAQAIDAQTFGEPGNRTFRLRTIGSEGVSVSLWLEKQQLQALDMAFGQLLAQMNYTEPVKPEGVPAFPDPADHDFKVGRMAVGYDPMLKTMTLYAFDISVPEEDEEPTLAVRLNSAHCAGLRVQLQNIIKGGRPVCGLCGASIDAGGHVCIRTNGHSKQPIPEDRADAGDE